MDTEAASVRCVSGYPTGPQLVKDKTMMQQIDMMKSFCIITVDSNVYSNETLQTIRFSDNVENFHSYLPILT